MQRADRLDCRPLAHASTFLLVGLGLCSLAAAQTSGSYLKQLSIERVPEDVAQHPIGHGVAIVRAVQRDVALGVQAHPDEIVVVMMSTGERGLVKDAGSPFAGHGLTATLGGSDLVGIADMVQCAVLIGQRHVGSGSNFVTAVDIVDLSDAYGGGGKHSVVTSKWESAAGFGFVNDVAISNILCYAIVNHKNEARVFDMDPTHAAHPQWAIPLVANPGTELADPTFQRDSVVVTSSISDPGSPHRAVVVTCRKDLSPPATQVTVLGLEDSMGPNPVVKELEVLLAPRVPDGVTREPHDVAMTPNNHMAVVVADDVVALFDLINATPTLVDADYTTNSVSRDYSTLADSLVVTDSYAVTLGATAGGWQADVYSISTGAMTKLHSLTGTGQPHDIDRSADGIYVAIRTTEDVVLVKNPLNVTLDRTDISSPSGPLVLNSGNFQYDSIVVTRKWGVGGAGGFSLPRQYAAVIARGASPQSTARVDLIDLYHAGSSSRFNVTSIDLPAKAGEPGNVVPASIKLLPGGRGVTVCAVGAPFNLNPEAMATGDVIVGTDAWLISLEDTHTVTTPPTPAGVVFQCEREGYPRGCTDPLEASAARAISLSSLQSGNRGLVHTIQIH